MVEQTFDPAPPHDPRRGLDGQREVQVEATAPEDVVTERLEAEIVTLAAH